MTYIKERRQRLGAMRSVMRYCMREDKTWDEQSQRYLVSGINCDGNNAILEFETTKAAHGKLNGTNFYQYVQSFSPEEPITRQEAHEVAKEFAARTWPDSEVLVATHCDAQHIHSHFIINSVSFRDGKKLRQDPNTLKQLRKISDEICQAHHLSVLSQELKRQSKGVSAREYRTAVKGESWKFRLINTIDECMKYASTKEEFISLMESAGYAVRWEQNRKSITYTTPKGMKCRDNKLHEEKYLKEVMEDEFRIRAELAAHRTAEIAARIETDKSDQYGTTACTNHAHRHSMSDAGRNEPIDAAGRRDVLGDARNAGVSSESEIPHRPDSGEELIDGDRELPDEIDLTRRTGWEAERETLFSAQGQTSEAALISDAAFCPADPVGIVGGVVRFGYALERTQNTAPIIDSTTRQFADGKALRREKQKKIAHGQKADDHENKPTWEQTL